MEEIVITLIKLVILVLAALIGRYLVPIAKYKLDTEKVTMILTWTNIFVEAAEQMITGSKKGAEKKAIVTELLSTKLKELGIKISESEIEAIIEQAVKVMNEQAGDK